VALDLGRDILHLATRRSDGDGGLGAAWQSEGELPAGAGPAPAGAALAVVDPFEQGVACTLSLGGLFGSGRMAPETGLFLARSTGGAGLGGPVMVVNPHLNTTLFAGGGALGLDGAAGPGAGAAALLSVLRTSVIGRKLADEAVSAPRSGAGEAARVEAVACLYNRSEGTKACNAASDPRGSGLAFGITQSNK
jgi:gamma-glutamyltranspeptidase/glutathione hydrolase